MKRRWMKPMQRIFLIYRDRASVSDITRTYAAGKEMPNKEFEKAPIYELDIGKGNEHRGRVLDVDCSDDDVNLHLVCVIVDFFSPNGRRYSCKYLNLIRLASMGLEFLTYMV